MEDWSSRMQRQKHREIPREPKEYFFEGYPVEIVENFARANRRIVVIETQDGDRLEVFVEQLESGKQVCQEDCVITKRGLQ